jgi:hypothetical protein
MAGTGRGTLSAWRETHAFSFLPSPWHTGSAVLTVLLWVGGWEALLPFLLAGNRDDRQAHGCSLWPPFLSNEDQVEMIA